MSDGIIDSMFDPRREVPALLEAIGELACEFRDVYEGNAMPQGLIPEAMNLLASVERLRVVTVALTATALVGNAQQVVRVHIEEVAEPHEVLHVGTARAALPGLHAPGGDIEALG